MGNIPSRQAGDRSRRNTAGSHYSAADLAATPLAWTDCFLQTVRGHQVTITGTEPTPTIEAVAHPAEVEDTVEKIDSAIENANTYVKKVVHFRQQARRPDNENAETDQRQKLQAELDQLAENLSKPGYSR